MSLEIKQAEYYNIKIDGNAGDAYKLLSTFSKAGVSLLAFKAIPTNDGMALFSLIPNDPDKMKAGALNAGLELSEPYSALIITSDTDEPGECAEVFNRLSEIDIKKFEFSGIADIKDAYGIVLYLQNEDSERAFAALSN